MVRKRLINFYKDGKRNYEICLIINNKLSQDELTEKIQYLSDIVTKFGQEIVATNSTKTKDLAYEITKSKEKKGYFVCLYIKSDATAVNAIITKLKVEQDVLRAVITLANPKKQSYGIFAKNYEENYKSYNSFYSYDDPNSLQNFTSESGTILKKSNKKIKAKKIRQIKKVIKLSRICAMLPFVEK